MEAVNLNSFLFGKTTNGLALVGYRFGKKDSPRIFILGGVHGNEPEGVVCANALLRDFSLDFPFELELVLLPALNLDGVLAGTRVNARGVDLNRNLPSNDWNPEAFNKKYPPGPKANSEIENQYLVEFLDQFKPQLLISLHSYKPLLNINGDCKDAADAIHDKTGYEIVESIGYPTPGCLGTYAGIERNWPTITYEIENGSAPDKIVPLHLPAIHAALKTMEN